MIHNDAKMDSVEESPMPLDIISEDLVDVREQKVAGTSSIDFDGLLQTSLQLHEDAKEGCGGQLWPAGMVLAKYLIREAQLRMMKDRTILELGAGGGLVGLALALALNQDRGSTASANPAVSIHMTDQASMIPLMRRNIELNRLSAGQISAGILDWGTANDDQRYDVILAAECVYFEPAFPLLLKTMKHYIGKDTVCYFCFKKRRKADLRFMKEAKKMFRVEDVADDPDKEIWSRENLFMYKITSKQG